MRETKFIEQNQEKWAEFEDMLRENNRDPERLNDLFIQITDDLSYARTFYPNRSVRMYLNGLAQKVFHDVYRGKRFPLARLRRFWTDELPFAMWQSRQALLLAFGIFVLAFVIGIVSSIINPEFARIILGDDYVEMTLTNIRNKDPMAVYKEQGPLGMTVGIAANNLFVALRTAILGVLASIGTLFILLYNGVMVGAFQYFFVERGVFWQSFLTIWIHGTLEISAIVIAGAAGLTAGSGLLFPGTYTRVQAFQISMRRGLKIFIGIVPIIVLAAVFEGFLTRYTQTPDAIRLAFILSSLAFVLWYFVWLPWHKAKNVAFNRAAFEKELPPEREYYIDFNTIKSAGEIMTDAFLALRSNGKALFGGMALATALFCVPAFILSDTRPGETFYYGDKLAGVLSGMGEFWGNESLPHLFYLQTGLFAMLAVLGFWVLEKQRDTAEAPSAHPARLLASAVAMLVPAASMCWVLTLESGLLTWTLSVFLIPFLALWGAVLYFETPNPFAAFGRAVTLVRRDHIGLLGILGTNMGLLLILFLDTPVWRMVLQLFSWMVPPDGPHMSNYTTIGTTIGAAFVLYLTTVILMLGGALSYFSNREIRDAAHLYAGIEKIGQARQIRGIAKE
jgi:uncharacterized membrane protein SpoIIM required for sporulation